jgi:putative transcriptional regulator
METADCLVGKLLIAMPNLTDPNFRRSVVLLGVHSTEEGAFGLVINHPIDVELADVMEELGENVSRRDLPEVLSGGPVQPSHGFVLFEAGDRPQEAEDLILSENLRVSGSSKTLVELAEGTHHGRFSLVLGYSGWYPGQLEAEIEQNSWLIAPLDTSIIFDVPYENRWVAALRSIGVEPGTLVDSGSLDPS